MARDMKVGNFINKINYLSAVRSAKFLSLFCG
jgi:hypothetical protein